jgi:Histidine kinase-like ATPase domain
LAVLPRRRPESDFSLVIDVQPIPEAVPHARRAVAAVLVSWGLAEIRDDAVLCLSEAVTNALTHARPSGTVTVRVYRDYSSLRIEIADADHRMIPAPRAAQSQDRPLNGNEQARPARAGQPAAGQGEDEPLGGLPSEHGWGLRIVDALCSRWGTEADHAGKRVWFELDIPASGQSPPAP